MIPPPGLGGRAGTLTHLPPAGGSVTNTRFPSATAKSRGKPPAPAVPPAPARPAQRSSLSLRGFQAQQQHKKATSNPGSPPRSPADECGVSAAPTRGALGHRWLCQPHGAGTAPRGMFLAPQPRVSLMSRAEPRPSHSHVLSWRSVGIQLASQNLH